jgi:hypothetical protein
MWWWSDARQAEARRELSALLGVSDGGEGQRGKQTLELLC